VLRHVAHALVVMSVVVTASCGETADETQLRALVGQAGAHLQAGRHTEAIHAFERALKVREEVPTLLALAQLHAATGRWDDVERYLARAKKLSPLSSQVQLGLADAATARGRWDEARTLYAELAERLPVEDTPRLLLAALADTRQTSEPAQLELVAWRKRTKVAPPTRELLTAEAMLARTLGTSVEGANPWDRARSAQVGNVERAVRMARIYLRRGEWAAAQILLEGAVAKPPAQRPHFILLAAAAIENADLEAARVAVARADTLGSGPATVTPPAEEVVLRARIDIGTGHAGTARDRLRAALSRSADHGEDERARLQYWLARSLLRLDAIAEARKQLLEIPPGTSAHPAAQLELAQVEIAGGELAAALTRLETASAREAPVPTHILLANLHDQANRNADAERVLRRALAQHPRATSVWLALAKLLHRSERSVQARTALEQILRDEPTNADALGLQAQLAAPDDVGQGIALYRKLLTAHPKHAAALNNLALLLTRSADGLDEALSLAQRAAEVRPDDSRIADTLGWIHHLRGEHGLARPLLERAVAASPRDPQLQYHLGAALLAAGESKRGRTLLRAALAHPAAFEGRDAARALLAGDE
jgi:tetratricopeptide (TPR) repeat protein